MYSKIYNIFKYINSYKLGASLPSPQLKTFTEKRQKLKTIFLTSLNLGEENGFKLLSLFG
jgi:hypothetical protein